MTEPAGTVTLGNPFGVNGQFFANLAVARFPRPAELSLSTAREARMWVPSRQRLLSQTPCLPGQSSSGG